MRRPDRPMARVLNLNVIPEAVMRATTASAKTPEAKKQFLPRQADPESLQ